MVVGIVLAAQAASAQVTGSFDGGLTPRKTTDLLGGAAVFTQTDKLVSGTIVLPADLSMFGGAYLVTGKATPKRVKVSGMGVSGAMLKYKGKIVGDTITGKAKIKDKDVTRDAVAGESVWMSVQNKAPGWSRLTGDMVLGVTDKETLPFSVDVKEKKVWADARAGKFNLPIVATKSAQLTGAT